jgi:hypothetical protein
MGSSALEPIDPVLCARRGYWPRHCAAASVYQDGGFPVAIACSAAVTVAKLTRLSMYLSAQPHLPDEPPLFMQF